MTGFEMIDLEVADELKATDFLMENQGKLVDCLTLKGRWMYPVPQRYAR